MSIKPILFNTEMVRAILDGRKTVTRLVVKTQPNGTFDKHWGGFYKDDEWILLKEPYGPGDILYVRETWFQFKHGGYAYRADSNEVSEMMREDLGYKWRPSIHMPREAARIWLRVTDVRVERLQEITGDGCAMEGIPLYSGPIGERENYYRSAFCHVWDSTIKPADRERYGWAANPWVWAIRFERCEKPEEDA